MRKSKSPRLRPLRSQNVGKVLLPVCARHGNDTSLPANMLINLLKRLSASASSQHSPSPNPDSLHANILGYNVIM